MQFESVKKILRSDESLQYQMTPSAIPLSLREILKRRSLLVGLFMQMARVKMCKKFWSQVIRTMYFQETNHVSLLRTVS